MVWGGLSKPNISYFLPITFFLSSILVLVFCSFTYRLCITFFDFIYLLLLVFNFHPLVDGHVSNKGESFSAK